MKFVNKFLILTVLLLTTLSCKKDPNIITSINGADAIIKDAGNPASDGCGWLIFIDNKAYSPDNLDASYQKNNLKVNISYDLLKTKYQCGLNPNTLIDVIHIRTIRAN